MSTAQVVLDASAVSGMIFPGGSTPPIAVPANGQITVPAQDAPSYLAMGCKFVGATNAQQSIVGTPRLGTAGRIVGSTALANGTLSIANQPDVPRQVNVRVDPGTSAVTGGNLALRYTANDGTDTTSNISLLAPASTPVVTASPKGVVAVTSAIVTAVAGGASSKIQIDDSNSLSMAVPPNFAGFTLTATFADGTKEGQAAVASSAASYTPSTAPNGTHTYIASFGVTAP